MNRGASLPGIFWPSRPHLLVALGLTIFAANGASAADQPGLLHLEPVELPVGPGAQEPGLFGMPDGRLLMSWTEPSGDGFAVKVAMREGEAWSVPTTAVEATDLFVNWSDFPSVAAFADGTLAVHWLRMNGRSGYAYDVNIALSPDAGRTWPDILVPHRDGTQSQHGFVSMLPLMNDEMLVLWLDGRVYGDGTAGTLDGSPSGTMQLRSTRITSDGRLHEDTLVDADTCSCCQTSAATAGDGTVLVAYRDRTEEDIRDISLVRLMDGQWSEPVSVHVDGWEISGCPVNGPAIDAQGRQVVVAWFTEAGSVPAVNVAFSRDAGQSFDDAMRLDLGNTVGRVDAVLLEDGSAVVTWVEWTAEGEFLLACRVIPQIGCEAVQALYRNTGNASINFPRTVRARETIYFAWSEPSPAAGEAPTIRMLAGRY